LHDLDHFNERIQKIRELATGYKNDPAKVRGIISHLDLTTLNATDSEETVRTLAERGIDPMNDGGKGVAAVCVFPNRVRNVKEAVMNTGINVASVAGGFPSGMTSTKVKLEEVRYAIDMGADEIDLVICRADILSGSEERVYEEVAAVKGLCGNRLLKVIIETCELRTNEMVHYTSMIAMNAGADFIKTSTGKGSGGATPEHAMIMAEAIRAFYRSAGRKVGLKTSGGISDIDTALFYLALVSCELGGSWVTPTLFRIGASSLLDEVISHKKNAG
jgi:deoxyribose-phosphate aldolase